MGAGSGFDGLLWWRGESACRGWEMGCLLLALYEERG